MAHTHSCKVLSEAALLHCCWQRSTDTVQTPTLSTRASASWCCAAPGALNSFQILCSIDLNLVQVLHKLQPTLSHRQRWNLGMFNSQSSGSQTLSSSSFSSSPGAKSSNKRWTHRCSWIEISVQFYHQLQFFSIQLIHTHTGGSLLALLASNFISLKLACTVSRVDTPASNLFLLSFQLCPSWKEELGG